MNSIPNPSFAWTPTYRVRIAIALIVGSLVFLDQVSKIQAHAELRTSDHPTDISVYTGRRVTLLTIGQESLGNPPDGPAFVSLSLNYVRNVGAAWGALSDLPDAIRVPFFYLVTLVAGVVIFMYLRSTPIDHRLVRFALYLVLAGAIGNFIDRIRYGYVIDWIDVRWNLLGWRYNFPNFNIADSAITVGIALMILDMLFIHPSPGKSSPASSAS